MSREKRILAGAGGVIAIAVAAVLVAVFAFNSDDNKGAQKPTPRGQPATLNNLLTAEAQSSAGTNYDPSLTAGASFSAAADLYDPATVGFGAAPPSQSAVGSLSATPNTAASPLEPLGYGQQEVSFGTAGTIEPWSSKSGLGASPNAATTLLEPSSYSDIEVAFGDLERIGAASAPASLAGPLFAQSFLSLSANTTSEAGGYSPAEVNFGAGSALEPVAMETGTALSPNAASASLEANRSYSATELNFATIESTEPTAVQSNALTPNAVAPSAPLKATGYTTSAVESTFGSISSTVPGATQGTGLTGSLNDAVATGYQSGPAQQNSARSIDAATATANYSMFLCGTFNGKKCVPAFRNGKVPASSRSLTFVVSFKNAKGIPIQLGIGNPATKTIVSKTKVYIPAYANGTVWWPFPGPFQPQRIDGLLIVKGKVVGGLPVTIA